MPAAVFINYRTGDEESAATHIDATLAARFGREQIFRASQSIESGQRYPEALITAVRRSTVLLAVIGPRWLTARAENGRSPLFNEDDWTRKEIIEAFTYGVRLIPVLVGAAKLPKKGELPTELEALAECQYERFNHRYASADLTRLGDILMKYIPSLSEISQSTESLQPHTEHGRIMGNVGTVVNDSHAPFHTGSGSQYNTFHPDDPHHIGR
ncbi:toll/interleukin-1 receptor domain-containing protein [Nonomuraea sp. NPDC049725]|uniref:toll/interleukin-1 receptor domain-containing protein n=1 Tax=Nonomuraea sp. NPDC049725 TaxID=3154508 RepID=UPI00341DECED